MPKQFVRSWVPLAAAGTIVLIGVYAAVQQVYRQDANDPQIELAENAAVALEAGYQPQALVASIAKVDMSRSLSVFGMIFDDTGKLVASSAVAGQSAAGLSVASATSAMPYLPPAGIFGNVRAAGSERLTWQTASGQRYAAVVMRYQAPGDTSGFVLAARSLREVESRISLFGLKMILGWVIYLVATALVTWVMARGAKG